MSQGYRTDCISEAGRFSNGEFADMMADVVRREKGSAQRLFLAVAPLLIAFYGGQIQAGRARLEDLEQLVHLALVAVYRGRASLAVEHQPFRAWLLDIARSGMNGYSLANHGGSVTLGSVVREARRADAGQDAGAKPVACHGMDLLKRAVSVG